jgi:hypothetical protein
LPIPKVVVALVAVVFLGACGSDEPTPEEQRQDRIEERLSDTFPPAQVTCIVDGLDDATMIALDETGDLKAGSDELATYSFVVRACAADPESTVTTTTAPGTTTTAPGTTTPGTTTAPEGGG